MVGRVDGAGTPYISRTAEAIHCWGANNERGTEPVINSKLNKKYFIVQHYGFANDVLQWPGQTINGSTGRVMVPLLHVLCTERVHFAQHHLK